MNNHCETMIVLTVDISDPKKFSEDFDRLHVPMDGLCDYVRQHGGQTDMSSHYLGDMIRFKLWTQVAADRVDLGDRMFDLFEECAAMEMIFEQYVCYRGKAIYLSDDNESWAEVFDDDYPEQYRQLDLRGDGIGA